MRPSWRTKVASEMWEHLLFSRQRISYEDVLPTHGYGFAGKCVAHHLEGTLNDSGYEVRCAARNLSDVAVRHYDAPAKEA